MSPITLKRTISLFHKSSVTIYVNGKLISVTNKDSVHISFTGNVKELNCNTCDIDGDAFTVHGNSVKVKGKCGRFYRS